MEESIEIGGEEENKDKKKFCGGVEGDWFLVVFFDLVDIIGMVLFSFNNIECVDD